MITIKFSCPLCGLKGHELQIPARESEQVNVADWMGRVIVWCADEHRRISPNCHPEQLHDVMIPLKHTDGTEAEYIGQQLE